MIGFALTDDQLALAEMVRKFVDNDIIPVAAKYDESGEFPHELIKKAWELGLMNLAIPQNLGGLGLGVLEDVIINEELGAGCLGMTTSISVNNLGLYPILLNGTDKQIEQFVAPFLKSPILASFCLTEPGSGSDAGSLSTHAKEDGDHWVINGSKMWITNAGFANQFTVFATVNRELKARGIVCLVVPADAKGVSLGKPENKMGQRASDTRAITFDNVRVPKSHLIGKVGEGFRIALTTLDHTRPPIAAGAVGAARAAMNYAIKYAKERKQFNQPIANFQGIQFMLADMATSIEAGRLMCHKAAWLLDQERHAEANLMSAHAKRFSADMAMQVATDAVQIFGGYGYTKEYPVEKIMRDVKLVQIYEGTSQVQRIVISRALLKD
ncbi:MAG: acyl-CoA dehydrogenase family protein [Deltaproteobacteria bacterium]|nr:acyl-CoA dehydrogenase family protein [Deltaproteobacteria bacterium]MBI3296417.1 acyl-CoA dehydrogenase family protein [Deltaproteobacteria bacterium]